MRLHNRIQVIGSFCVGFLTGCMIAQVMPFGVVWFVLVIGLLPALVLLWSKVFGRVCLIFVLGLIIGILMWQNSLKHWNIDPPVGEPLTITASVTQPLEPKADYKQTVLHILSLQSKTGKIHLNGDLNVVAQLPLTSVLTYGNEIKFDAKLQRLTSFGTFDGVRYWRVRGVAAQVKVKTFTVMPGQNGSLLYKEIFKLKKLVLQRIYAALPGQDGYLLAGLLFGAQSGLAKEISQAFRTLGISHLTAVSGYNLTIIALWPVILAGLLPKRLTLVLAAIFILFFVIFTGLPSSIVRAAIMAWVVLLGKQMGRAPHALLLIIVTATVMAALNPFVVKDDAGFGLSFLAFFGLVELGPLIEKGLTWIKRPSLKKLLAETLGAEIATLPYLLGIFGQFSLVAPLANLIVLPLVPAIMIGGLIVVLVALVPLKIFSLPLASLHYPLHWFLLGITKSATIPYASIPWPIGGYFPWYLSFLTIIGWVYLKRRRISLAKTGRPPPAKQSQ